MDTNITDYLPWITELAKTVNTHDCVGLDVDDLVGYGVVGLLDAAGKYDESFGVKFKTYAEHRVLGEMRSACRNWREAKRNGEPRVMGSLDSGGFGTAYQKWVEEKREDQERIGRDVFDQCRLAKIAVLLGELPENERTAVILRYWMGLKNADIGKELGCNSIKAHRYVKRGMSLLRAKMVFE